MMKGEYNEEIGEEIGEEENEITNTTPLSTSSTQLFPKFLSPPPHFLPYPHHHHQHHHHNHHLHHPQQFQPTQLLKKPKTTATTTTTTTSSDDGGGGGGGGGVGGGGGGGIGGGTVEVSRRPRGRPPGSKNKPKPPTIITREPDPNSVTSSSSPSMSPYILELPPGSDLIDSLTRFTRRRGLGLCVLTATGSVENVTLKQPSTAVPGGTVTFHGRFDVLSLSATLIANSGNDPSNSSSGHRAAMVAGAFGVFTISVAGPAGQIVGGKVVAPLVCGGTVYVVATSFCNPVYCRLPLEGVGESDRVVDGGGRDGGGGGQMELWNPGCGSNQHAY